MKKTLFLVLFTCSGCGHKVSPAVNTSLTDSGRTLKIMGLDAAIAGEIGRTASASWSTFLPVYKMPADTDMKNLQPLQPGKYVVDADAVLFTPDTPFKTHQTYFLRCYRLDQDNSAWDYIRRGKKLGKQPYTDYIFKQ